MWADVLSSTLWRINGGPSNAILIFGEPGAATNRRCNAPAGHGIYAAVVQFKIDFVENFGQNLRARFSANISQTMLEDV
jgi:hypothetical protein